MPDDFVNNFGLMGNVLFRKRNERREQERLDKELERELVKITSKAGYSLDQAREIAQMQIAGDKERQLMENEARLTAANMGEVAAGNRQERGITAASEQEKRARSDELERLILNNMSGREMATMGNDAAMARERARATGDIERDAATWERERGYKERMAKAAESEANARRYNAAAQWLDTGEPLTDADRTMLGIPMRPSTGTLQAPTTGRTASPARISLKPTKPGETPRNPDSAARPIPVTPAAAPSSVVKSNDVPSLGTPPAPELSTTNAPITWRDIPVIPSGDRSERAIIDEYIQQLVGRPAVKISPK